MMNDTLRLALWALLFGAVVFAGYRLGVSGCEADKLESTRRAIEQANEQAAQDAELNTQASAKAAALEQKTRIVIKESVRYVASKPSPVACNLDACRMCLDAAVSRGDDGKDCPCRPDVALPTAGSLGKP